MDGGLKYSIQVTVFTLTVFREVIIDIPALDCTPDFFTQGLGIDSLVFLWWGKRVEYTHQIGNVFAARQVNENCLLHEKKIYCFSGWVFW